MTQIKARVPALESGAWRKMIKIRLGDPIAYLMIAPAIILLLVFFYYPVFQSFYMSLFNWPLLGRAHIYWITELHFYVFRSGSAQSLEIYRDLDAGDHPAYLHCRNAACFPDQQPAQADGTFPLHLFYAYDINDRRWRHYLALFLQLASLWIRELHPDEAEDCLRTA